MSEGEAWRRVIAACVAAVCLTAIVCCWLLRPYPYVHVGNAPAAFDKRTGNIERVKVIQRETSTTGRKAKSQFGPTEWGAVLDDDRPEISKTDTDPNDWDALLGERATAPSDK